MTAAGPKKTLSLSLSKEGEDKNLQVIACEGARTVSFSLEDEWYGDSDSGFGATLYIDVTREDAAKLVAMLTKWLNT